MTQTCETHSEHAPAFLEKDKKKKVKGNPLNRSKHLQIMHLIIL